MEIKEDFLFYESGRRIFYVGRCSGNNEEIGWHVRGKMAGLWTNRFRVFSSITLEKAGQVLLPVEFENRIVGKQIEYYSGKLCFLAHPEVGLFYIEAKALPKGCILRLKMDSTAVWLESDSWVIQNQHIQGDRFQWQLFHRDTQQFHTLYGQACGATIRKQDNCWLIQPNEHNTDTGVSCEIRIQIDQPPGLPFAQAEVQKRDYYRTFLSAFQDNLFFWAQLNSLDLFFENEQGAGFVAGLPEYPWWFGIDSIYTCLGLLNRPAMIPLVRKNIENLLKWGDGLPLHEVTTTGKVHARARMNELLAFAFLLVRYTHQTGDNLFQESLEYTLRHIFRHVGTDGFPIGEGIIEVPTPPSPRYLDCACWWIRLLKELSTFPFLFSALNYRFQVNTIFQKVQHSLKTLWKTSNGLFYDYRTTEVGCFEGHFIQIYPFELGLLEEEEGKKSFQVLHEQGFFNAQGMIHSLPLHSFEAGDYGKGIKNELVWSLPTLLALRAASQYGQHDLYQRLLDCFYKGLNSGMKGAIPELFSQPEIPNLGCIVQGWNGYLLQNDEKRLKEC